MSESDSTTLRVKLLFGNAKLLDAVRGLRGEGLVHLKNVDVVDSKTAVLEGGGDGVSGTNSHHLRGHASDGEADNTAVDFAASCLSNISTGEKDARGTIGDLTRVTGSGCAVLLESGLQLGEAGDTSVRSDTIILVDGDLGLVAILILNNALVRSNLRLETSIGLSSSCLLVALDSHSILGGTIDTELFSDVLRSDSHRHETVVSGFTLEDLFTEKVRVNLIAHVSVSHGLKSTTDTAGDLSSADSVSDGSNSLESGGAEAVDASDAGGLRVASHEHGHTSVGGSGARVEHVADDDVLNHVLVDAGHAGDLLEDGLEHGLETSVSLRTPLGAGHGSAGVADNDDVIVALGADRATVVAGVLGEVPVDGVKSLHVLV